MYRNLDWYEAFQFSYDMSVPNVAHLEAQRGGCCTIFPYFIGKILEIPLTTSQDYSLFQILNDYSIDLWKRQIEIIRKAKWADEFYYAPRLPDRSPPAQSLRIVVGPSETNRHARQDLGGTARRARSLVACSKSDETGRKGDHWEIEGPESNRASVAFAVADGDGDFV